MHTHIHTHTRAGARKGWPHLRASPKEGSAGSSTASPAAGVCTPVSRPASSCRQQPTTAAPRRLDRAGHASGRGTAGKQVNSGCLVCGVACLLQRARRKVWSGTQPAHPPHMVCQRGSGLCGTVHQDELTWRHMGQHGSHAAPVCRTGLRAGGAGSFRRRGCWQRAGWAQHGALMPKRMRHATVVCGHLMAKHPAGSGSMVSILPCPVMLEHPMCGHSTYIYSHPGWGTAVAWPAGARLLASTRGARPHLSGRQSRRAGRAPAP